MLLKLLFDISLRIRQVQLEVLCDVVNEVLSAARVGVMGDSRGERGERRREARRAKIPFRKSCHSVVDQRLSEL